ncbi:MAG: N-acetylglucosamine-6-phosphate deacetylase, partial [Sphaerochaetaceae bacterium]
MATTLLLNGTVITGSVKLKDCALFIDSDGTIGDVFHMSRLKQKSFPSDSREIDVRGAYITPGLIDTHIHGIGGFG